ncbi:MAG: TRAP transporter substrate-binding protein DctP [Rhodospirillales bacterium]
MKSLLKTLALSGALSLALGIGVGQADSVTLKMNHQMPATAVGSKVDQWFADQVEKRTKGEVKIKVFWSGGLGKASETLSLLQAGAVDMAGLSPGYFPAELPLFTAPNSFPMAIDNIDQASTLMERLVAEVPGYAAEAKANGIKPLFFHVLNPYLLVSVEPITNLEEMQGVKMRTWGSHMPKMVEAAGGTAVTLGLPDIYEALSRGVVDAAPFAVDLVVTYNIFEVAKNISEITLWDGPTWGVWITEAAWSKLTPEQQKVVSEVAEEARKRDLEAVRAAAVSAKTELMEKGVTFHAFSAADAQAWKQALPPFFEEWVVQMDAEGKGESARQATKIWTEVVGSVD